MTRKKDDLDIGCQSASAYIAHVCSISTAHSSCFTCPFPRCDPSKGYLISQIRKYDTVKLFHQCHSKAEIARILKLSLSSVYWYLDEYR